MTAILFGLITACFFASSSLMASRSVRMIGAWSGVSWMMAIGLVVTLPITLVSTRPDLSGPTLWWWLLSGAGNVVGLVLAQSAFRIGKVGIVAPVLACEGAIAAVLASLTGESIAPLVGFLLLVIVIGIVVTSIAPDPEPLDHERPVLAVLLASLASLGFGSSLFATGFLSGEMDLGWLLLPSRLIGTVALFLPLLATRRLRITRPAVPLVIGMGLAEVFGFTAYSFGAQESVAIASVLASQFAPISAILAYLLFRERLGRLQITGVSVLVAAITALSIVQATS